MEDLWHRLDQDYPKLPPTDKKAVHRHILLKSSETVGSSALEGLSYTIHAYLRDRYTHFKSWNVRSTQNREAIAKVNQRVEKILASWSGEEQCPEFQWHMNGGRPSRYSTPEAANNETGRLHEQYPANHRTEGNHASPSARGRAQSGGPWRIPRIGARQPRPKEGRGIHKTLVKPEDLPYHMVLRKKHTKVFSFAGSKLVRAVARLERR